jgi:hypothetical protein
VTSGRTDTAHAAIAQRVTGIAARCAHRGEHSENECTENRDGRGECDDTQIEGNLRTAG